jgi:hypothetical protein
VEVDREGLSPVRRNMKSEALNPVEPGWCIEKLQQQVERPGA